MPEIEFGFDRARQQGRQLGIEQGRQLGIEQGKQLGIEQGVEQGKQLGIEHGKLDMVKNLLLAGVDERIICKAAKLTKQELEEIKRKLEQS